MLINICYANVNLDSIEQKLVLMKQDTNRVNTLNYLCWNYIPIDINKSKTICSESISLSNQLNYKKGLAKAVILMSNIYFEQGNYSQCLEYNLQALKIREELGDQWGIAGANGNIGTVYQIMKRYDKALEYHQKALVMFQKLNQNPSEDNEFSIAGCLESISSVYQETGKLKEAMQYLQKALSIYNRLDYKPNIVSCMNNMGVLFHKLKKDKEALNYHIFALKLSTSIGDQNEESDACVHIASIYLSKNDLIKTITYAERSLAIAKNLSLKENISEACQLLSQAHLKKNDFKKAYEYFKLYSDVKDSVFTEASSKLITEMQAKYETEKKEQQITLLSKERELQYVELNKQKIIIWSVIGGFILVLVFAGFIFRSQQITRRQKNIIEKQKLLVDEKNMQLNQQNEEICTQRDEIEAQRDLVTEQKEHIEEIHKEVTDSINYAKRIQEAVLPVTDTARSVLGEHFILFKPKDIVSGDFYWTTKINNLLIVTVADCTGHGVPGAFMSMLGISFLNEIVRKQEVTQANHVLNHLREEIINALQQKGMHGEQKDGMDISLLVINTETNECQWAGANNPLYVIAKEVPINIGMTEATTLLQSKISDISNTPSQIASSRFIGTRNDKFRLIELKGDKMPIAIYPEMKDFTNHEFTLNKGDSVYLFTDGYADQFGGPKGKKFKYLQLQQMLLANQNETLTKQKEILDKTFDNWKGLLEQVDDVCLIGIRL